MTYGFEEVILLETRFPTLRTSQFYADENDQLLSTSLDLGKERGDVAIVQFADYWQKSKQGYEKGIKTRPLVPRDLVLRKVVGIAKNPA